MTELTNVIDEKGRSRVFRFLNAVSNYVQVTVKFHGSQLAREDLVKRLMKFVFLFIWGIKSVSVSNKENKNMENYDNVKSKSSCLNRCRSQTEYLTLAACTRKHIGFKWYDLIWIWRDKGLLVNRHKRKKWLSRKFK